MRRKSPQIQILTIKLGSDTEVGIFRYSGGKITKTEPVATGLEILLVKSLVGSVRYNGVYKATYTRETNAPARYITSSIPPARTLSIWFHASDEKKKPLSPNNYIMVQASTTGTGRKTRTPISKLFTPMLQFWPNNAAGREMHSFQRRRPLSAQR